MSDSSGDVAVTPLHQRPVSELLDFIRTEMDAGRLEALTIVATGSDMSIFRETWISPSGSPSYSLIGLLEAEKASLLYRLFQAEDDA